MKSVPMSERKYVSIFGNTNVGKSSLFNSIIGQDIAIVSDFHGTTTDPIIKAMELIPFGPIVLVDTAGLNDETDLSNKRVKKTENIIDRTDLALYVCQANTFNKKDFEEAKKIFTNNNIPYILIFNKCDICMANVLQNLKKEYPEAIFTSINDIDSLALLRSKMCDVLKKTDDNEDESMINGLVPEGSTICIIVPIDSQAPKGRLILPQVQLIRDCLDHGIKCHIMRYSEFELSHNEISTSKLVVVDSQIFGKVDKIIPKEIPLTSFSILLARQKGNIKHLVDNAKSINNLKNGSKILIAEACSHNHTHEDIGRVKIPMLLEKYTGKQLQFEYRSGYEFPDDLNNYDIVVHCGSCMITKKTFQNRIKKCIQAGVPITNYGILLAYLNGILERCCSSLNL